MAIKARVIGQEKGLFKVETISSAGCEGCTSCSKGRAGLQVLAKADRDYAKGSLVDIDMPSADLNAAAFWVYGLPLIIIIAGIFLGTSLASRLGFTGAAEGIGVVTGLILGAIYYVVIRRKQSLMNKDGRFTASILGYSTEGVCTVELKKSMEEN